MAFHAITVRLKYNHAKTLAELLDSILGTNMEAGYDPEELQACRALGYILSGPVSGMHSLVDTVDKVADKQGVKLS